MSVHGPPARARAADDARAPTLTPVERSFLQGVLTHLPAICAFTLPTAASYARMVDGIWSGGTYAAWGTDNRETPVRLCGPRGHHHFEVKCVDATAAPHLAIAALVGAGLKGIVDGAVLTMGDCPKPMWEMTEQEKVAVGMTNPLRLPTNIVDARKALVADKVIEGVLGANFVHTYIGVNEVSAMRPLPILHLTELCDRRWKSSCRAKMRRRPSRSLSSIIESPVARAQPG